MEQAKRIATWFKRVFPRPVFEDEQKTRVAAVTSDITGIAMFAMLGYLALYCISPTIWGVFNIMAALLVLGIVRVLLLRGWVSRAILLVIFTIIALYVTQSIAAKTFFHLQAGTLYIGVVFAALMLGWKWGVGIFLLNCGIFGLFYWLMVIGYMAPPYYVPGAVPIRAGSQMLTTVLSMFMLLAISLLVREHLTGRLRKTGLQRDSALQKLEAANMRLEALLEAKTHELDFTVAETKNILIQNDQLQGLSQLVAGISHELGTPVGNAMLMSSSMQTWAVALQEKAQSGSLTTEQASAMAERYAEGCDIIARNLKQVNMLVSNFKQISADQVGNRRSVIQLSTCVDECLFMLKPLMEGEHVTVTTRLDDSISMDTYPGSMVQIITNLLSNAVMHGLEGRQNKNVHITSSLETKEDLVTVTVTDNGVGIDNRVIGKIFEPFFTTKRGRGGVGIGLSIVHNLVTALDGEISVATAPGSTAFTFKVPRVAPALNDPVKPVPSGFGGLT